MPALLPIILTASHLILAADTVPKFDVEKTCLPAAAASVAPGRGSADCQRDENEARAKLDRDWAQYNPGQRAECAQFSKLGSTPSYVELLTCLEMAKQAKELPEASKMGTPGSR
ncbi:MAG TPA: hypothetical protein VFI98_01070 [Pseudolabrys sp.]|nr:hypothetical protein [Pseudolabrys sp.]